MKKSGWILILAIFSLFCQKQSVQYQPEAIALLKKGVTLESEGHYLKAIEVFSQSAQLEPKLVYPEVWLGKIYLNLGYKPLAKDMFSRVIQDHPTHLAANLAKYYLKKIDNSPKGGQ